MRVQSAHSTKRGGWLHPIDGATAKPIPRVQRAEPTVNWTVMLQAWQEDWSGPSVNLLALRLGVSAEACIALGAVWASEHKAWAWPMRDAYGNVVGIRLRNDAGRKWAVTGSHQGLFIPSHILELTQ